MTGCEQRYSQTEKEALGVVWACERFHVYVYGMTFVVETDHKPLETIYGPRSRSCARIQRWVLRLQPYDFSVIHRPGRENIADPLSRLLHRKFEPNNHQRCTEEYATFVAVSAKPTALTTREIEEASADDAASPQTSCGVCFCSSRIYFSPRTSAKHSRHLRFKDFCKT